MPIFTDILKNGRTDLKSSGINKPGSLDARDWYRDKAREVRSVKVESLIRSNPEYNRTFVRPGLMYLFGYDPKLKETLPYYDKFPLIFPFEDQGESFLGMNLHYLPHIYRARLMDLLYELASDTKFNDKTKIRMSYNLLNSAARYKYFKPCVKRYLHSHVTTRFLLIPSNEWDAALFLPLERFAKNTKGNVYRESREFINAL